MILVGLVVVFSGSLCGPTRFKDFRGPLNDFMESVVSLYFWYIGLCSREMPKVQACFNVVHGVVIHSKFSP